MAKTKELETYVEEFVKSGFTKHFIERNKNMDNSTPAEMPLMYESIEDWKSRNTDGPGGVHLTRFRRTKEQMERGLTREQAFNEYNIKVSQAGTPPQPD